MPHRPQRVTVRLSDDEARMLDGLRVGETRPDALRRLLREASSPGAAAGSAAVGPADEHEALTILSQQARSGSPSAAVALARILAVDRRRAQAHPIDPVQRRRDELAARRRDRSS